MKRRSDLILSYEESIDKIISLKERFEFEIEISCLNSAFSDISTKLTLAKNISEYLSERTILRESEFHDDDRPYYEFSLFCNREDLERFKLYIAESGLEIDVIHDVETGNCIEF